MHGSRTKWFSFWALCKSINLTKHSSILTSKIYIPWSNLLGSISTPKMRAAPVALVPFATYQAQDTSEHYSCCHTSFSWNSQYSFERFPSWRHPPPNANLINWKDNANSGHNPTEWQEKKSWEPTTRPTIPRPKITTLAPFSTLVVFHTASKPGSNIESINTK